MLHLSVSRKDTFVLTRIRWNTRWDCKGKRVNGYPKLLQSIFSMGQLGDGRQRSRNCYKRRRLWTLFSWYLRGKWRVKRKRPAPTASTAYTYIPVVNIGTTLKCRKFHDINRYFLFSFIYLLVYLFKWYFYVTLVFKACTACNFNLEVPNGHIHSLRKEKIPVLVSLSYSRTFMVRTPLEPWKHVRCRSSSS